MMTKVVKGKGLKDRETNVYERLNSPSPTTPVTRPNTTTSAPTTNAITPKLILVTCFIVFSIVLVFNNTHRSFPRTIETFLQKAPVSVSGVVSTRPNGDMSISDKTPSTYLESGDGGGFRGWDTYGVLCGNMFEDEGGYGVGKLLVSLSLTCLIHPMKFLCARVGRIELTNL